MCAPSVISMSLRHRWHDAGRAVIKSERDVTRGDALIRTGALTPTNFAYVVDLTHPLRSDFPLFPGVPVPRSETIATVASDGWFERVVTLSEHTGTHLDAPAHFADGDET